MNESADVIVVGLGAMGSAVLCQLARRGLSAIGIDRFDPPHPHGSSHGESRITRVSISEGARYTPFVRRSHELWRELEALTGRRLLEQVGALFIAPADGRVWSHGNDFVREAIRIAQEQGIAHERLDEQQIAGRFPQFRITEKLVGYFEPGGGFVRPEECIAAQLDLARRNGAQTATDTEVVDLIEETAGVRIATTSGDFHAKQVVLAAGAWLPKLAGKRYRNLTVQRQVQFWFRVSDPSLWRGGPIFIWTTGTRAEDLFYGFPMASTELRIKVASEHDGDPADPDAVTPVTEAEKRRVYETHIAPRLNGVTAECVDAATCLYTNAPGYQFVIEPHPSIASVTVVSACSGHGFKHSAGLGEAIAQYLTGERPALPLAHAT
ncbi:MAG TPA: N-methyl-L-tryptophan oxidase [Stellaceae bacterium]